MSGRCGGRRMGQAGGQGLPQGGWATHRHQQERRASSTAASVRSEQGQGLWAEGRWAEPWAEAGGWVASTVGKGKRQQVWGSPGFRGGTAASGSGQVTGDRQAEEIRTQARG